MTDWFEPTNFAKVIQKNFEDLFYKYGVDLYLNGHVHGYERSWPVYQSKEVRSYVQPDRPIHILSGSAGNIEGMNLAIEYTPILPLWTAYRSIDPSSTDKYPFFLSFFYFIFLEANTPLYQGFFIWNYFCYCLLFFIVFVTP